MQGNEDTEQTLRAGNNTPSHPKIVAAVQIYILRHQNEGRLVADRHNKEKTYNSRTVLLILSTERTQPSISSDSEQGLGTQRRIEYCRACRKSRGEMSDLSIVKRWCAACNIAVVIPLQRERF
jgi:hypothetical protein